jgi:hypothetical protein
LPSIVYSELESKNVDLQVNQAEMEQENVVEALTKILDAHKKNGQ